MSILMLMNVSTPPSPPPAPHTQVSHQREGERETHPSVYCTAQIWGEGEGTLTAAPPNGRPPRPMCLSIEGGWAGGREGRRDTSRYNQAGTRHRKTKYKLTARDSQRAQHGRGTDEPGVFEMGTPGRSGSEQEGKQETSRDREQQEVLLPGWKEIKSFFQRKKQRDCQKS